MSLLTRALLDWFQHWDTMTISLSFAPGADRWDWSAVRCCCHRETTRILGPGPQAEDAAQEAVLRAWRHRDRCRDTARWRPWVRQIATREALRLLARGDRLVNAVADLESPVDDPDVALRVDVRRAVATLDAVDRELLALRYWADMPHDETARLLNLPAGTAKVRLHRSRKRLRAALEAAT